MSGRIGAAMVVGGGVSGVQAALDLSANGYKVYLVDEAPAIGGRMAQLDKTFPTNDCSTCILSPKLVEAFRNPDIKIITNATVNAVDGGPGDFTVSITKRPRYVDESKCVGCGNCTRYCPVKIRDPFNQNLSTSKAIGVPFAQAVPLASVVDPEQCLFLTRQECKICVPVCKSKAINMYQPPEQIELRVGAIVLSPGYQPFDPSVKAEYGYGRFANVVTSLEYERMTAASGPDKGEVRRPSDKKHPERIAWIQCVGSRDVVSGNHYCSAVCCTYAAKQIIVTKEHCPEVQPTVFFNEVRAFGKGFEQYYERARCLPGVRFLWSTAAAVRETPEGNVVLRYSRDGASTVEEEFDLVVLSVGMVPSANVRKLAEASGVRLNDYGFCATETFTPGETSRPGVYAAGAFTHPMDIPESVATGSAAVSLCAQLLSDERGALVSGGTQVAERDIASEEPRIGVFVCRCGTNIGSVVDVPGVVRYASGKRGVTYVQEDLYGCAVDSIKRMAETIAEKRLNRVIVAACTPRTHEPLFRETLRQAGLNPYMFEMANIREHCSWVHSMDKEAATVKAKDLVRMALAKSRLLEPLEPVVVPLTKSAMVVGGGVAGMTCAESLAGQGYKTYLAEKSRVLGGLARRVGTMINGESVTSFVEALVQRVGSHPLIEVITNSEVSEVGGFVGNYKTRLSLAGAGTREIEHGVVVLASGGEEAKHREYLYGADARVMTLLEMEEALATLAQSDSSSGEPHIGNPAQSPFGKGRGTTSPVTVIERRASSFSNAGSRGTNNTLSDWKIAVIIGCVGSREPSRPYCSRVCCSQMVKCALRLKEAKPDADVYVLNRDMRTYGFDELCYKKAAEMGVRFVRFDIDTKPEVVRGEDRLKVVVFDRVLDKKLELPADVVGLAVGAAPSEDSERLSKLYKVPLNEDGFFLEAHLKLKPVEFAAEGVFLCGLAHSPKTIDECISQAQAAAARAGAVLSRDRIEAPGVVAAVQGEKCIGCRVCKAVCPFEAVVMARQGEGHRAEIIAASCKGCGQCSARCPRLAITMNCFSDEQVMSQVAAAVGSAR